MRCASKTDQKRMNWEITEAEFNPGPIQYESVIIVHF